MIRVAWRQFRIQAYLALGALAMIGVVLAVTGPNLVHLYDTTVKTCQASGDCTAATSRLLGRFKSLKLLGTALVVLPSLIGAFWGAPLVAGQLENGTFRLAWTQSVTRSRWLLGKLAVVGGASVALAGVFSLMVTWWSSPIDRVEMNRFSPAVFAERGIAPLGYAAFAFALGVTAGVIIRRTLPAMAVTLIAFLAAREIMVYDIRPHLIGPAHINTAIDNATSKLPNAWVYSSRIVDHVITYQPANRYWTFQALETVILMAAAVVLAGVCFWWVRHRLN